MNTILAIATIASALLIAWQVWLLTRQVRLQRIALEDDQRARAAQRAERRASLLTALRAELRAIQSAAELDYGEYKGYDQSNPRVEQGVSGQRIEGERRHRLGFPWTPLPDDTINQAIGEAALLGLTSHIEKLNSLRGRILRVNTLVRYKMGLFSALMQAEVAKQFQLHTDHWAEEKGWILNNAIEAEVHSIIHDCKAILESWRFEADAEKK